VSAKRDSNQLNFIS